jgi:hypothetical protein
VKKRINPFGVIVIADDFDRSSVDLDVLSDVEVGCVVLQILLGLFSYWKLGILYVLSQSSAVWDIGEG